MVYHYANYTAGSISTLIDRFSGEVEHKGENKTPVHEGKSLIGKFERKGVLYCRQCEIQAGRIKAARD